MRRILAVMCALFGAATAQAAAIVDAAFVKEALARDAIVWDVRSLPEYRKGHIPGAVTIGDAAAVLRDPNSEDFIATEKIEKILGDAGIDPSREVIVYGARGSAAAHFGRFALTYFGGRRIHVFHDGIEGWVAAGNPSNAEEQGRAAVALKLKPQGALATQEVVARLNRPGVQIVDARTPREYAGEDIRAIRGGHIPGAVNIPYERNWKDPETQEKLARRQVSDNGGMALKSREELKALYAGLDAEKETVVYCQSGVRAAQTASVLEDLGFRNVKVYDSSWLGYAAKLDAPAANETFVNVGQMNSRIGALSRRVEELEKLLMETWAAMGAAAVTRCPGGAAQC